MPDMREVARDIIDLDFKELYTLKKCMDMFYAIMRKHGIKQGISIFNEKEKDEVVGIICDNPEWVMARTLFEDRIKSFIFFHEMDGSVPEDIQYERVK